MELQTSKMKDGDIFYLIKSTCYTNFYPCLNIYFNGKLLMMINTVKRQFSASTAVFGVSEFQFSSKLTIIINILRWTDIGGLVLYFRPRV